MHSFILLIEKEILLFTCIRLHYTVYINLAVVSTV